MISNKYIDESVLNKYTSGKTLSDNAIALIAEQVQSWPLCSDNYSALNNVKVKLFEFDNFNVKVQFNPGRIISSSAKVDSKSIKERKCFLCYDNLPNEQKAIPYYKSYLLLVNPFPIFPEHLTIPKPGHLLQSIKPNFVNMLALAKDLGKDFVLFYNGPKCGASAPDHMHFQAGSRNFMPLDEDLNKFYNDKNLVLSKNGLSVYSLSNYLRNGLVIKSKSKEELIKAFENIYSIYQKLTNADEEPMLNVLAYYRGEWEIVVFPRQLHRPEQYFAEDDKRILFSPASVDLGGVMITPRKEDFDKITKEDIVDMYRQVCISLEYFEYLKKELIKKADN